MGEGGFCSGSDFVGVRGVSMSAPKACEKDGAGANLNCGRHGIGEDVNFLGGGGLLLFVFVRVNCQIDDNRGRFAMGGRTRTISKADMFRQKVMTR